MIGAASKSDTRKRGMDETLISPGCQYMGCAPVLTGELRQTANVAPKGSLSPLIWLRSLWRFVLITFTTSQIFNTYFCGSFLFNFVQMSFWLFLLV